MKIHVKCALKILFKVVFQPNINAIMIANKWLQNVFPVILNNICSLRLLKEWLLQFDNVWVA